MHNVMEDSVNTIVKIKIKPNIRGFKSWQYCGTF